MDLPEVTEVKRLRLEPGDALLVRVNGIPMSERDAAQIKERVRAHLQLGADFPILLHASDIDVEVVSRGRP